MTPAAATTTAGKLLVATTNLNKLREIRPLLAGFELVTLAEFPPVPEPVESGATFWENARIKALAYAGATGLTTVAEDSGFEVDLLGGEPGVRSARFLGPTATYDARFEEIYRRLAGRPSGARFVTALAVAQGNSILFETDAAIDGMVAEGARGEHGFGYDPIFWYPPLGRTTAELTDSEKAIVSHRARAFRDFRRFLVSRGR